MQSYLQYRRFGHDVRRRIESERVATAKANSESSSLSGQQDPTTISRSTTEQELAGRPELNRAVEDPALASMQTAERTTTQIGHALDDVEPRDRTTREGKGEQVFVVGWTGEDDESNPMNWSEFRKLMAVMRLFLIAFAPTMASSIDSTVLMQASQDFGVSEVAESLATGIYLMAFGCGALLAGPLSETFGRNPIYIGSLCLFMCWILGAALAPNFGAQMAFRFLAGFVASPPLTVAGGSIADMYDPLAKTYAFPLFAISGFGGPILGPVISAWIGPSSHVSWRWTEWVSLIMGGITLAVTFLFQEESYAPILLKWKAAQLRKHTGDQRFKAQLEIMGESVVKRIGVALARPFLLIRTELIVGLMALYLTVIYIILFTFLDGFTYIFMDVYGTSQGITFTIFVSMFIGVLTPLVEVPLIYSWTKTHIKRKQQKLAEDGEKEAAKEIHISPETRLWFAMFGAPTIPISLFWLAWTDYASVSIWSPILAVTLFGYGVINIFMSAYMYIIDSYTIYAASALTFTALVRYLAAGGMTVVGIPFYENVGTHWTLSGLGIISAACVPIPYALYIWGRKVRQFSKYAVNKSE